MAVSKGIYPKRCFQYRDDQEAREAEEELVAKLAATEHWADPEFPAAGESLYLDPHNPPRAGLPPFSFDWLRINALEIIGMSEPKTCTNGAWQTKGELVQGALGDRWLLSAFAIVATNPKLLEQIFVSDKHKDKGIYTLKLFKGGQWRYIHIDDRIPCSKAGKPYFVRSRDQNEAWPLLLEKAYAKLHGCYEAMQAGGRVEDGLKDLLDTGVVRIEIGKTAVSTEVPQEAVKGSRRNSAAAVASAAPVATSGNLFELITKVLSEGGQVAGSLEARPIHDDNNSSKNNNHRRSVQRSSTADGKPGSSSAGGATPVPGGNKNKSSKSGLLASSAYMVVEAKRFYAEPTEHRDGQHVFLFKVKNAWGEGAYKGPWSAAEDPSWSAYPKLKADFFPPKGKPPMDPAYFYMTYQEFVTHFNTVYLVHSPNEETGSRYTYQGRWLPGDPKSDAGGCPIYPTFPRNPQYAFQCTESSTTMVINLSQYDNRWQAPQPPLKKFESMLGFFLVKLKGLKRRQGRFHTSKVVGQVPYFHNTRSVSGVFVLPAGRYAIVPCTYVPAAEMERFILEVFFDVKAEAEQLDGNPADVDERESDDEGLEEEKLNERTFEKVSQEAATEDATERVYQSLQLQVAELSRYIFDLKQHVEVLETSVLGATSLAEPSLKPSSS